MPAATDNYLRKSRQKINRQANASLRAHGGPIVPMQSESWASWLLRVFSAYVYGGFSARHVELWSWVWSIVAGAACQHFVAIWPRGGGKSTTAELACVAVAARRSRRYILYVSETQEQADKHVETI